MEDDEDVTEGLKNMFNKSKDLASHCFEYEFEICEEHLDEDYDEVITSIIVFSKN